MHIGLINTLSDHINNNTNICENKNTILRPDIIWDKQRTCMNNPYKILMFY